MLCLSGAVRMPETDRQSGRPVSGCLVARLLNFERKGYTASAEVSFLRSYVQAQAWQLLTQHLDRADGQEEKSVSCSIVRMCHGSERDDKANA